jgi:hypothetical protein
MVDPEPDTEKAQVVEHTDTNQDPKVNLDRLGEQEGYILDVNDYSGDGRHPRDLKLAHDNTTVLIPQPSQDPNDPLNWSQTRKNLCLLIISCCSFLPDYGSATGAVTLIAQAQVYGMSEDEVNHSQVGNVFMLGAGGLFVTVLSAYFGRLPVLVWFLVLAVGTAAWCAGAAGFDDFMAARILNGFFSTVAQSVWQRIIELITEDKGSDLGYRAD